MTDVQIGDIVCLNDEFCSDAHTYMQVIQTHADLYQLWCNSDVDFSAWLKRTRWIVHHVDIEFVYARCEMLFAERKQNFFHDEIVRTGERHTPNDTARYQRTLFEV